MSKFYHYEVMKGSLFIISLHKMFIYCQPCNFEFLHQQELKNPLPGTLMEGELVS